MTEREIRQLLAAAMAYDNRSPGDAAVMAWAEAARRSGWTLDTALEALHAHYAESAVFVMPGHITNRIRQARRQPVPYRALPPAEPARQDRVTKLIEAVAKRLSWPRATDPKSSSVDVSAVECPHCQAQPGQPCGRTITRGPHAGERVANSGPHPSRVELASGLEGNR